MDFRNQLRITENEVICSNLWVYMISQHVPFLDLRSNQSIVAWEPVSVLCWTYFIYFVSSVCEFEFLPLDLILEEYGMFKKKYIVFLLEKIFLCVLFFFMYIDIIFGYFYWWLRYSTDFCFFIHKHDEESLKKKKKSIYIYICTNTKRNKKLWSIDPISSFV